MPRKLKQKSSKPSKAETDFAKELLLAMVARPIPAASPEADTYTYNARGALEYAKAFYRIIND